MWKSRKGGEQVVKIYRIRWGRSGISGGHAYFRKGIT